MSAIANILWEDKVLTTYAYKASKGLEAAIVSGNPYNWESTSVALILKNVAYIGVMKNFKSTCLGFKSKKRVPNAKEMRTYIENAHTPLIDRELWDKVQMIRANKRRPTKNGATSIFTGLLECADCGTKLSLSAAKNYLYFRCSKYTGKQQERRLHTALYRRGRFIPAGIKTASKFSALFTAV